MNVTVATMAEAMAWGPNLYPTTTRGVDVVLKNGIAGTPLAEGDLVILDTSTVSAGGDYTQVIAPTAPLNLATAFCYHLICQEAIAAGGSGRFRLYGHTKINLNANTGANALISSRGTNRDCSTTMVTLTKVLGLTKETGTGVKMCFFDGRPAVLVAP